MLNGSGPKEYGGHKYADHDGTSSCEYGCGSWMGTARSGGPAGLDPGGLCPKNPKDGQLLGGNADYEYIVTQRIWNLQSRLYKAEEQLKLVSPDKAKLVDELAATKAELAEKNWLLSHLRRLLQQAP